VGRRRQLNGLTVTLERGPFVKIEFFLKKYYKFFKKLKILENVPTVILKIAHFKKCSDNFLKNLFDSKIVPTNSSKNCKF